MCFHLVGDVQVKRSKNKQRVAKMSQRKQNWASHESIPRHGFAMPQHELIQSKTQGWHAAACPIHDAACHGGSKTRFSIHAAACQIMLRHDDADKTLLFLASRVLGLLCNTTFFVSIKRK